MLHVRAEHIFLWAVGAFSHNFKGELVAGQALLETGQSCGASLSASDVGGRAAFKALFQNRAQGVDQTPLVDNVRPKDHITRRLQINTYGLQ